MSRRAHAIRGAYHGLLRLLTPVQWTCMPVLPDMFFHFPIADRFLLGHDETSLNLMQVTNIILHFASSFWAPGVKFHIQEQTSLLINGVHLAGEEAVKLAATVYFCSSLDISRELVGVGLPPSHYLFRSIALHAPATCWDEILRLECSRLIPASTGVSFSLELSQLAVHLIGLAGLNPLTATPIDMDVNAARFVCPYISSECVYSRTASDGRPLYYAKLLTWRETVSTDHFL